MDSFLGDDLDAFFQSLDLMGRCFPEFRLLPAHGGELPLLAQAAANSAARLHRRNQVILDRLGNSWSAVPQIVERIYGPLAQMKVQFRGISLGVVMTQLDWLVSHGRAETAAAAAGPLFRARPASTGPTVS